MKSTDLSTAYAQLRDREFKRLVRERKPWIARTGRVKGKAFDQCWLDACRLAMHTLALAPLDVSEFEVVDVGARPADPVGPEQHPE